MFHWQIGAGVEKASGDQEREARLYSKEVLWRLIWDGSHAYVHRDIYSIIPSACLCKSDIFIRVSYTVVCVTARCVVEAPFTLTPMSSVDRFLNCSRESHGTVVTFLALSTGWRMFTIAGTVVSTNKVRQRETVE